MFFVNVVVKMEAKTCQNSAQLGTARQHSAVLGTTGRYSAALGKFRRAGGICLFAIPAAGPLMAGWEHLCTLCARDAYDIEITLVGKEASYAIGIHRRLWAPLP